MEARMKRWHLLIRTCLLPAALVIVTVSVPVTADRRGGSARFDLVETTIAAIHQAYDDDVITPEQLVQMYLKRIDAYDKNSPTAGLQPLNSYLYVNPRAVKDAHGNDGDDDGDHDSKPDKHPLAGIPMILKDNIDTKKMPTTAGSNALNGSMPPDDAFIARKLRKAGAIIMGKGSLTEFANFLTNGMPAGYDSELRFVLGGGPRVGYGFNPFDPRTDPRAGNDGLGRPFNDGRQALSPGGSSSGPGIAVSANLATVGIGTETSGSILSPGTQNLLVGIKPTVGLVSRDGIIPITADQDTAGPLARTVTDAAKVLGVIAGFDPADPATAACLTPGKCLSDYTRFLNKDALRGARIAVPYYAYWTNTAGTPNLTPTQLAVMNDAITVLRSLGAYVEEHHDIPDQTALNNFPGCGPPPGPPFAAGCSTVLLYGFKRDLNAYLASLGPKAPVHNIAEVVAYNAAHPVTLKYDQFLAVSSNMMDTSPGSPDTLRYQSDRANDLLLSRTNGLDVVYKDFDAILFPANRGANIAARAGYPSIVVPGGFVTNKPELNVPPGPAFPAGFDPKDAPYGVTFSGPAFSEPKLIGYAYAFEQATHHRVAPSTTPPLASDVVVRH
jgi:amidase